MDWQGKKAQYAVYLVLLCCAGVGASVGYHGVRPEMVLYRRAETALSANDRTGAIALYRQAVAAGLREPRARVRLAEAYRGQGDVGMAIRELEEGLRLQPEDQELLGGLARLYGEAGQLDKGIALAPRLSDDPATRLAIWQRLGDIGVSGQEFDKAVLCYRKALDLDPGQAVVSLKLAATLGWLRRYDEAMELYGQLLARQPDNRAARLGLARVLGWAGRLDEAIQQYRTLLEKDA